jgi:hypothetical protein
MTPSALRATPLLRRGRQRVPSYEIGGVVCEANRGGQQIQIKEGSCINRITANLFRAPAQCVIK